MCVHVHVSLSLCDTQNWSGLAVRVLSQTKLKQMALVALGEKKLNYVCGEGAHECECLQKARECEHLQKACECESQQKAQECERLQKAHE